MIGTYIRDSVTWLQYAGRDDYGDESAPTEVALSARVNWEVKTVRDSAGQEVVSTGHILMADKPRADEDRIKIDGVEYVIIAAKEAKSFGRISHYTVYLQ